MAKCLAVLLMCFSTVTSSAGGFLDGNKLLELLKEQSGEDRAAGVAYVLGVVDALNKQRTQYKQCFALPERVTSTQVADVVQQFLERNPSGRHFQGANLAASALETAFPCSNKP